MSQYDTTARPGANPGPSSEDGKNGQWTKVTGKQKRSKKQLARSKTSTQQQQRRPRATSGSAARQQQRYRKRFTEEETAAYQKRVRRRSDLKKDAEMARSRDQLFTAGTIALAVWPVERKPDKFYPARILALQGDTYEDTEGCCYLREVLVEYLGRYRTTKPAWVRLYWRGNGDKRVYQLQPTKSKQAVTFSARAAHEIEDLCDERLLFWNHKEETQRRKKQGNKINLGALVGGLVDKELAKIQSDAAWEAPKAAPTLDFVSTGNSFAALTARKPVEQPRAKIYYVPYAKKASKASAPAKPDVASRAHFPEMGQPLAAPMEPVVVTAAPPQKRNRKTRRGKRGGRARKSCTPASVVSEQESVSSATTLGSTPTSVAPSPTPASAAPVSESTPATSASSDALLLAEQRSEDLRSEMQKMRDDHAKQMRDMMATMMKQQQAMMQKQQQDAATQQQVMMQNMMTMMTRMQGPRLPRASSNA